MWAPQVRLNLLYHNSKPKEPLFSTTRGDRKQPSFCFLVAVWDYLSAKAGIECTVLFSLLFSVNGRAECVICLDWHHEEAKVTAVELGRHLARSSAEAGQSMLQPGSAFSQGAHPQPSNACVPWDSCLHAKETVQVGAVRPEAGPVGGGQ